MIDSESEVLASRGVLTVMTDTATRPDSAQWFALFGRERGARLRLRRFPGTGHRLPSTFRLRDLPQGAAELEILASKPEE